MPYDLAPIVDWIGQAQLYVLVRDETLKALHNIYVRDVFDLRVRLQCHNSRSAVYSGLGVAESDAPALLRQLDQDPLFGRLAEVRAGLLPQAMN